MGNFKRYIQIIVGVGFCLQLGCGVKQKKTTGPASGVEELSYCGQVSAYADGITLIGVAQYQYLKPVYQQLGGSGLSYSNGSAPFTNKIRYAEVVVKASDGSRIQCGETDNNGQFSVVVPRPTSSVTYTIEVNSRGDNSSIVASILNESSKKEFYTESGVVSVNSTDSTVNVPTIEATLSGNSGAFHIFEKIRQVNEFLRTQITTANCSLCENFTVAPKVTVYWIKGFNPASYLGESEGLSFFDSSGSLDSEPSLYILGGSNGDVDYADTDHFDDSVIIHEYGHFLEKHYWKTDSPGGVHNGNMIIDPRLAFSEGFADFLPGAVTGSANYLDTRGTPMGSTSLVVHLDLEKTASSSSDRDKIQTLSPIGEGIYREVSISRALFDYLDANSDQVNPSNANESSQLSFSAIWLALTSSSFGLMEANQHFVSMGHFNKALYAAVTALHGTGSAELSAVEVVRLGEYQTKDSSEYAAPLVSSGTQCSKTISPVANRSINTGGVCSSPSDSDCYHDLFMSSDFYQYVHPGGTFNLQLTYTVAVSSGGGNPPNLDLYVYKEHHSLSESSDVVAYSNKARADEVPGFGGGFESVSVNLPAGTYMILVNVDTESSFSGTATYDLRLSGGQSSWLCPSP